MMKHTEFQDDPEYQDAVAFMQKAECVVDVDYEWVWAYAGDLWKERNSWFSAMDEKADSIIKYLGGGTGLFALGLLSKVEARNVHLVAFSIPAIFLALVAILFAMIVRKPSDVPGLPSIKKSKEYAEGKTKSAAAMAAFLGQWHLACVGLRLVCLKKAMWLGWAMWLYYAAIAWLLVPLVLSICLPVW